MKLKNKTSQDAHERLMLARLGCFADRPTDEYLDALERKLHEWVTKIHEFRASCATEITHEIIE